MATVNITAMITLRHAGLADLATVAQLARTIWREHYPGILTDAQIEYMLAHGYAQPVLAAFVTQPGRGIVLGERAGRAVGFAAWRPEGEPATLKLDKLYVRAEQRGAGVGAALLEHVAGIARAAGCGTLVLNVNRGNAPAIAWYERRGLTTRERVDVPIGAGFVMEDFVMARRLG